MEHSSPVSKVVATATNSTWAQAYSAGKLHLVLSLSGESEESIASIGKDTLERLQREFFALDEKTLAHLKKVVETVTKEVNPSITLSLVLTTIVEGVLYIVIFNAGAVLLKRDGKIITVGCGEAGAIAGFSGTLSPSDIVLVGTQGLLDAISPENIEKSMMPTSPHEISENLAPFMHSKGAGTEAGLVWSMIGARKPIEEDALDAEHPNDTLDLGEEKAPVDSKNTSGIPSFSGITQKIHLSSLKSLSRKQLIILAAVILVIILAGSILFEKSNRENKKQNQEVQNILNDNKQKYDDAIALMSLNKSLAVEELQEVKTDVENKKNKFPTNSEAVKTLDAFLAQVNSALGGNSTATASKINVFFDAGKNSDIPTVSYITVKGGEIAVIGSKKGGLLKSDGSVDATFNGADSLHGISADEKNVYILTGNTVEKIAKSDGAATTIIKDQPSPTSIDNFGGNIYLLSSSDKTVYKYIPTAFNKADYFTSDTTIPNSSSLSIDSSIYVVSNGKILKFTRGTPDNFSYSGKALSQGSQIYTDVDYANLYVLDPAKKVVYVIDKGGNQTASISLQGMKNPISIAADEPGKKIYIVSDNKIYSVIF